MNKEGVSEESTTLISLISIMQNCLKSHVPELRRFLQLRAEYLGIKGAEQPVNGGAYDKSEYDRIKSLIDFYDDKIVAFNLLLDLQFELESNPFPGRQVRLIQAAYELNPDLRLWHLWGYSAWKAILREFELPSGYRIKFPVCADDADIAEVELTLLQLVREDNTILAVDVPMALKLEVNSKAYRAVKKELEARGWVWKSKRIDGVKYKVVVPPKEWNRVGDKT
jgi:hypothetical protein